MSSFLDILDRQMTSLKEPIKSELEYQDFAAKIKLASSHTLFLPSKAKPD